MADRTAAGGKLVGVDDVQFNRPVELFGGQDYMFNNPGQVWSSGKQPAKALMKYADEIKSATGQNPLYLTQAKVYDRGASVGPCLAVLPEAIPTNTEIKLVILRKSQIVFEGTTSVSQIKRTFEDLVKYLFAETSFEHGVLLMTGTGIIPSDDFTLQVDDEVRISIDHIGTLINYIKKKA